MKYLVNRKTKEHVIKHKGFASFDVKRWYEVKADSDGWIAWDCEADLDCPISEYQPYQARLRNGKIVDGVLRWDCYDNDGDVLEYRPIFAEKVQEPEQHKKMPDLVVTRDGIECADQKAALLEFKMQCLEASERGKRLAEKEAERKHMEIKEAELKRMMLLDRLKSAHEHAQQIPDLEAELREVLAGMGYDLVARSPFANQCCGNPEQCWEPCGDLGKSEAHVAVAEPDMSDWRNWREGDVLTCVRPFTGYLSEGENYVVSEDVTGDYVGIILQGDSTISSFRPDRFRFHSRPAKGEK